MFRVSFTCCALLLLVSSLPASDNIDAMLAREIPKLRVDLVRNGVGSVAVLPFRLYVPDTESVRISGSTIQRNLARRLEMAFMAFNSSDKPLKIPYDGWAQILEQQADATFLTPEGRKQLFDLKLTLPVGESTTKVDALIMGSIEPSTDFSRTKVNFEMVKPDGTVSVLKKLEVATDRQILQKMGRGFSLPKTAAARGLSDNDIIQHASAELDMQSRFDKNQQVSQPADRLSKRPPVTSPDDGSKWVELTVLYDKAPQEFSRDTIGFGSNFTIGDPDTGQAVVFQLKNLTQERLGVVLSVNGINTLYGGDATEPDAASKWVLEPGKRYKVRGIYGRDRKTVRPLLGANEQDTIAMQQSIDPGAFGLISLSVYRHFEPQNVQTRILTNPSQGPAGSGGLTQTSQGGPTKTVGKVGLVSGNQSQKQNSSNGNPVDFPADEEELTGFAFALMRGADSDTKVRRLRGFHPKKLGSSDNWASLAAEICKGIITQPSSRGAILAGSDVNSANLNQQRFQGSDMVACIQVRYLSAAQAPQNLASR